MTVLTCIIILACASCVGSDNPGYVCRLRIDGPDPGPVELPKMPPTATWPENCRGSCLADAPEFSAMAAIIGLGPFALRTSTSRVEPLPT